MPIPTSNVAMRKKPPPNPRSDESIVAPNAANTAATAIHEKQTRFAVERRRWAMNGACLFNAALNSAAEGSDATAGVGAVGNSGVNVARQLAHDMALESQHLPHAKQEMSAIEEDTVW